MPSHVARRPTHAACGLRPRGRGTFSGGQTWRTTGRRKTLVTSGARRCLLRALPRLARKRELPCRSPISSSSCARRSAMTYCGCRSHRSRRRRRWSPAPRPQRRQPAMDAHHRMPGSRRTARPRHRARNPRGNRRSRRGGASPRSRGDDAIPSRQRRPRRVHGRRIRVQTGMASVLQVYKRDLPVEAAVRRPEWMLPHGTDVIQVLWCPNPPLNLVWTRQMSASPPSPVSYIQSWSRSIRRYP